MDNSKAAKVSSCIAVTRKGPTDPAGNHDHYLPMVMLSKAVYTNAESSISAVDIHALGTTVVSMGGSRHQALDAIDYSVGPTDMARLGGHVDGRRPLAMIYIRDGNS